MPAFYAPCPFGLEKLLADEILALNADPDLVRTAKGGVSFGGGLELGMAVCLHSRLATRVMLRVANEEYWDSRDVYSIARRTPWEKWFGPDATFRIHSSAHRCPLESLNFATLRVKDGICDRFTELAGRRPSVDRRDADVRIEAYFTFDHLSLYIDLAGESLFKRGWRLEHGEAPLKENLAAALLMLSGWTPEKTLVDPFCGSGTIAIEAASIAANVAPGLNRHFDFEHLQGFDMDLWREMKEDARAAVNKHAKLRIEAHDISSIVVEKAIENARRAGFGDMLDDGRITFTQGDARDLTAPDGSEPGVIIANPPYGEQSNPKSASIAAMMRDFASAMKANFAGWTAWLLTSDRLLPGQMRLRESRKVVLFNGPLECRFFRFDMVAGSNRRKPASEAAE
ncbi:class I SAM-dependent RNA methyltransferase [Sutterella sp.]|uniref:THUMP domain-containing class I SAM-dependent RNA methyltransferase n=1 Tax=Sutterella sp. TaxID=1981025 RepID=UPI0026DF2295|nr:THUMP domain-containing protein [Sutterella sp.]MDO5531932.1 THUMP domain-containing protein [Sutterella sp.]